jgi:hypothetical protein
MSPIRREVPRVAERFRSPLRPPSERRAENGVVVRRVLSPTRL